MLSTPKFLASVSSTRRELVLLFWVENVDYLILLPCQVIFYTLTQSRPLPSITLQLFNCVSQCSDALRQNWFSSCTPLTLSVGGCSVHWDTHRHAWGILCTRNGVKYSWLIRLHVHSDNRLGWHNSCGYWVWEILTINIFENLCSVTFHFVIITIALIKECSRIILGSPNCKKMKV